MGACASGYYGFNTSTVQCGSLKYAIILMWLGTDDDSDIVIILHHWALLFAVLCVKKLRAETHEEAVLLKIRLFQATSLY
jgi:hypothetical protein